MKTCNKWLIGLSVFCVLLVPSIGASQTVEQSTGLVVFDDAGTRVGPVVGVFPVRQISQVTAHLWEEYGSR